MKRTASAVAAAAVAVLAACSDGGGGRGTAPVELDAANALPVSAATMTALAGSAQLAALHGLVADQRRPEQAPVRATGSVANAVIDDCTGGSVRGATAVADSGMAFPEHQLAPGGLARMSFARCQLHAGTVLDGDLDVRVLRFIGAPESEFLDYILNFNFRRLQIETPETRQRAAGDVTLFVDSTGFPLVLTALSGSHVAVDRATVSASLRDYDLAAQIFYLAPGVPGSVDSAYDGYLTSSAFSGEIRFQTLVPFRWNGPGLSAPVQGLIQMFGARGALLRLRVDHGRVQLELDADGDGFYETTRRTSWAALTG